VNAHLTRLFHSIVLCILLFTPSPLRAQASTTDWSVALLDQTLATVQPGQNLVQVGDMEILVSNLRAWRNQLAGAPSPNLAFDGTAPIWTSGNVYYTFDSSVSVAHQKVFLDGAKEWATFANLHFLPRTIQPNYFTVLEQSSLEGGQSAVGMVGGQQFLQIGPTAWSRPTICHELGHTLGLIHEHQRSNRDSFVTVLTNNIAPGLIGNFIKLGNSQNQGAYDFLSIMHYSRNSFSTNPGTLDTIVPLPAFIQYLNLMGRQFDPVLSPADRAGMAAVYGAAAPLTSVVTNTLDGGSGSLRAALYYAFDHPGTTITFNIPVSDPGFSNSVFNIQPTDGLPGLARATVVDGSTEPTNSNPNGPSILINGALATPPSVFPNGLHLTGTNCSVRSLIINGFAASGIFIDGTNAVGNVVRGCYLGVNSSGTAAVTNGFSPVTIANGASGNTVGGATASARNLISGGAFQGLVIRDPGTRNNLVQGNYIGLNAAGTAALSNAWAGVAIFGGAQANIIGGTSSGARNIISGNGNQGVAISGANTTGNLILGNYIGLNPSGNAAIPNIWAGVNLFGGPQGNAIGGTVPGSGNVISGNSAQGVLLQDPGTSTNFVRGNFIGVNASGTAAISNGWAGVDLYNGPQGNLIGGASAGAGNIISGNRFQGVVIGVAGTAGNLIQGNLIGLGADGTTVIPNSYPGGYFAVELYNGAQANVIGGGVGARNFISGNPNYGIAISGANTAANLIQGNTIGLNVTNGAAPNALAGVVLFDSAQSNQIGGLTWGAANLIANNLSDGVQLYDATTTNNSVRANSIFGNTGVGIGVYTGANRSAAAPTLSTAVLTTNTTISGNLTSLASTTFHLDFYASAPPANSAQATTYLGARDVVTSAGGTASFSTSFSATVPFGQIIKATATDLAGNTSPLSAGIAVTVTDNVGDGIPNAWRSAHFGGGGTTTNSQSCAACDPDHDGLNNLQEFLAGTDPNNAASTLRLAGLSNNGADISVGFQSTTGTVYRVEMREDLIVGGWSVLADQIIGTGGLLQVTNPGVAVLPKRFYRLDVVP
jgi:hypothetical protein